MKKIQPAHWILMLLFGVLLIIGINLGEAQAVLEKATEICLSCIGIG
jgi:hypothetical protein